MKKPIPPYFEYAPHSAKSEDKQIRAFRDEHDKDDKAFTRWNLFLVISIPVFTGLFVYSTVYLAIQYGKDLENAIYWLGEKEYRFLVWLDSIPTGYQFATILSATVLISVYSRYRKSSKQLKNGMDKR